MKKSILFVCLLLMIFTLRATAYYSNPPDSLKRTSAKNKSKKGTENTLNELYPNPLIPDMLANPAISEFNGVYYLYATSDNNQGLRQAAPAVVWKSKDFINWNFEGQIFPEMTPYRYTAPGSVQKKDGKYYLYFTTLPGNYQGMTHVATGPSPEGPFHLAKGPDRLYCEGATLPIADDIDGEPFVDDDGSAYLFWRRRKAARLSSDWLSIKDSVINIPTKRKGYSEGPFMFKRNGIYYYLYTLSSHADYMYAYMMSRQSPLGPFESPEQDIIAKTNMEDSVYGPGHGCVFQPKDKDYAIFVHLEWGHGSACRSIYAQRMYFNPDGTIQPIKIIRKGVGTLKSLTAEATNLALQAKVTSSSIRPSKVITNFVSIDPESRMTHGSQKEQTNLNREIKRNVSYIPENAVDNSNATFWQAEKTDTEPWIMLDLGEERELKQCEIYFLTPSFGHTFRFEKSIDKSKWQMCYNPEKSGVRSPHIISDIGKTRYIRINILNGEAGIWEIKLK